MAGSYSDYLEDKILKHVFTNTAYTSPSAVYVALFTVAPDDTGGGTEVSTSGTAYVRKAATFSVSGTATTASNSAVVEFDTATASWGTIVAFGIYDASSAGNLLCWADLTTSRAIDSGDIARFPVDSLTITQT